MGTMCMQLWWTKTTTMHSSHLLLCTHFSSQRHWIHPTASQWLHNLKTDSHEPQYLPRYRSVQSPYLSKQTSVGQSTYWPISPCLVMGPEWIFRMSKRACSLGSSMSVEGIMTTVRLHRTSQGISHKQCSSRKTRFYVQLKKCVCSCPPF